MGKTLDVARDRAFDQTKTVLPAEVARGTYMQNAPSLQALKLMHLMIGTAGGRMADEVQHQIRLSDIRKIDGMRNHDRASLTPLFGELAAVVLTHDDPEKMVVTIGGLLDEAKIDYRDEVGGDLLVSWWFRRTFRSMAAESNHWAILDRQTVFHLGSKYSVLLFQHISSLVKLDRIEAKTFTVPELRAVLGVTAGKLDRFANLKAWALSPAIAEINQLSRLTLTATPNKIGRTVASVTIGWQVKDDPTPAKRELQGHSAGRKARRDGSVEAVAVAFPITGGIAYSERWLDIKQTAGCNADNQKIASDFRRFLADRDIARDAMNIEQLFEDFCRKIGKI
ncbi:replication initiation protein [Paracoccus gahaiensis]|uniref:Replication initiation protein n=1 Tax=Paracoccus gahaiensis TaxID=1706839 RepID=A0A4U0R281_9RHOB|nr:replication initiation protein [Paracoccus gahaiensis]TJZ88855.1 replication initiation protein [Paracoccus gahaiensis]